MKVLMNCALDVLGAGPTLPGICSRYWTIADHHRIVSSDQAKIRTFCACARRGIVAGAAEDVRVVLPLEMVLKILSYIKICLTDDSLRRPLSPTNLSITNAAGQTPLPATHFDGVTILQLCHVPKRSCIVFTGVKGHEALAGILFVSGAVKSVSEDCRGIRAQKLLSRKQESASVPVILQKSEFRHFQPGDAWASVTTDRDSLVLFESGYVDQARCRPDCFLHVGWHPQTGALQATVVRLRDISEHPALRLLRGYAIQHTVTLSATMMVALGIDRATGDTHVLHISMETAATTPPIARVQLGSTVRGKWKHFHPIAITLDKATGGYVAFCYDQTVLRVTICMAEPGNTALPHHRVWYYARHADVPFLGTQMASVSRHASHFGATHVQLCMDGCSRLVLGVAPLPGVAKWYEITFTNVAVTHTWPLPSTSGDLPSCAVGGDGVVEQQSSGVQRAAREPGRTEQAVLDVSAVFVGTFGTRLPCFACSDTGVFWAGGTLAQRRDPEAAVHGIRMYTPDCFRVAHSRTPDVSSPLHVGASHARQAARPRSYRSGSPSLGSECS
eukprot:m.422324 g.422324  ORF g.422324 m.422324 type:complete len:559 (-) comp21328_c0_seq10:1931-3607(-)